jgi:hypothetical protein
MEDNQQRQLEGQLVNGNSTNDEYYTPAVVMTHQLTRYMGLETHPAMSSEQRIAVQLVRDAVTDYLVGRDAELWMDGEYQPVAGEPVTEITFTEAMAAGKLDEPTFRKKLAAILKLIDDRDKRKDAGEDLPES